MSDQTTVFLKSNISIDFSARSNYC